MESYDPRRRPTNDDPRYRSRPGYEDRGDDRERSHESELPRRAERGWLDYDRDYDRRDERERAREEPRYGQGGRTDRSSFSPDWSREGAEPRYSDDPYYARNRERSPDEYLRGRGESRQGEDQRRWDERARSSIPREQRELAERSRSGDYYSPDWPYERGGRDRGRDIERSGNEGQDRDRHYRGWYSRSTTPFEYPGGSGYLYSEAWTLHGPYTGRGPKGYKRSDQQIIEDACQRLERDGEIDASEIEVTAEDGVLRLRGTVQDRAAKRRAEQCVESVYGARDVMNELRVSQPRDSTQSSQGGVGSPGSQATQSSQAGRGSTPAQPSTSVSSSRTASSTSPPEQAPKH